MRVPTRKEERNKEMERKKERKGGRVGGRERKGNGRGRSIRAMEESMYVTHLHVP